jgi:ADP-ribose pyrophosphatase YjhB (NUDIX family)
MAKGIPCIVNQSTVRFMSKKNLRTYIAAYGILNKKRRFLIVKNRTTGWWSFPGGEIKIEEQIEDGLKREFFEELHLNVEVNDLIRIVKLFFANLKKPCCLIGIFYKVDLKNKTQLPVLNDTTENTEMNWATKKEILTSNSFVPGFDIFAARKPNS